MRARMASSIGSLTGDRASATREIHHGLDARERLARKAMVQAVGEDTPLLSAWQAPEIPEVSPYCPYPLSPVRGCRWR